VTLADLSLQLTLRISEIGSGDQSDCSDEEEAEQQQPKQSEQRIGPNSDAREELKRLLEE
jgi:hypothetical protein